MLRKPKTPPKEQNACLMSIIQKRHSPQQVGFKKLVFHPFFNKTASGSTPLK